jgi:hypothetical protein
VAGSGHTLLRRSGDWHRATARLSAGLLGLRALPQEAAVALALSGDAPGGLGLPLPAFRHATGRGRPAPAISTEV